MFSLLFFSLSRSFLFSFFQPVFLIFLIFCYFYSCFSCYSSCAGRGAVDSAGPSPWHSNRCEHEGGRRSSSTCVMAFCFRCLNNLFSGENMSNRYCDTNTQTQRTKRTALLQSRNVWRREFANKALLPGSAQWRTPKRHCDIT